MASRRRRLSRRLDAQPPPAPAPPALVLAISGATLWLEALPERANRLLGFRPGAEYA